MTKPTIDTTIMTDAQTQATEIFTLLKTHRDENKLTDMVRSAFFNLRDNWFKKFSQQGLKKELLENIWAESFCVLMNMPVSHPPRLIYDILDSDDTAVA